MMRASLAVIVLGTGYVLWNMLRPAQPEPTVAGPEELARARPLIAGADLTLANAALTGDKRLLFSDASDAFLMYQIAGRSWIALGDPVGSQAGAEELVWRLREISDHHGGQTVFYQVCGDKLGLYVDLGLAALKIGEEARVPLGEFSLEGGARAELRQAHRRAQRDGASFEVLPPENLEPLMPVLQEISDGWLASKCTGEKRFSVGAFSTVPAAVSARAGALAGQARGLRQPVDDRHQGGAIRRPHALRGRGAAQRHGLPVHRAHALGPAGGLPLVQPRDGAALGPGEAPARAGLASGR